MSSLLCVPLFLLALFSPIAAETPDLIHFGSRYSLRDSYRGSAFFEGFRWETYNDTTHGHVNYLDKETAMRNNLSYATENKFFMRADANRTVTSGVGRDSVRISSNNTFDEGVLVLDVEHMPAGCGTWTAFRTKSRTYPEGGLIDVIEGVNGVRTNLASLHTLPNCDVPQDRKQTGSSVSTVCDASLNANQGCGTQFTPPGSFGKAFNDNKGGWYVMQKSSKVGIKIWYWPRSSTKVPREVRYGIPSLCPGESWGTPDASFPLDSCKYEDHFGEQYIMFDMTFCGGWAGSDWAASCGAEFGSSCAAFVDTQPSAFTETYWEINALRVYVP